jgi:hypothetical protein
MKFDKNSLIMGIILGILLSVFSVWLLPFYMVHDADIGGFVFRDNKVYELTEMLNEPPQQTQQRVK